MNSMSIAFSVRLAGATLAAASLCGHAAALSAAASAPPAPRTPESVAREALMDALAPALALRGATAAVTVAPVDARRAPAPCEPLIGFIPPGARLVGKTLVGLRCADGSSWQTFVSADVRVDAPTWQATRALHAGETIGAADVAPASMTMTAADLDAALMAARTGDRSGNANLHNLASIDGRMPAPLGRIVLRPIAMGRALTMADVRDEGRINAGEAVRVVYQGDGFSVSSDGRPDPSGERQRRERHAQKRPPGRATPLIARRPLTGKQHRAQVSGRVVDRISARRLFDCAKSLDHPDFPADARLRTHRAGGRSTNEVAR
jgi:flagella basal body P-ring formation protein FlgA